MNGRIMETASIYQKMYVCKTWHLQKIHLTCNVNVTGGADVELNVDLREGQTFPFSLPSFVRNALATACVCLNSFASLRTCVGCEHLSFTLNYFGRCPFNVLILHSFQWKR